MPWQVYQSENSWKICGKNRAYSRQSKRRDLIQEMMYQGFGFGESYETDRKGWGTLLPPLKLGDIEDFTQRPEASRELDPHGGSGHGDVPPKATERQTHILHFPLPSLSNLPTLSPIGRTFSGVSQSGSLGKQVSRDRQRVVLKANEQMTCATSKLLQNRVIHHKTMFRLTTDCIYDDGFRRL